MVTRSTTYDYEQSSEGGRERIVRVPYALQFDATPTLHDPAAIIGLPLGDELCGTILTLDDVDDVAEINIAKGAIYLHNVRDALTYVGGPAEGTWQLLNVGDRVYYDPSPTMPALTKLSVSPLSSAGVANPFFGYIVLMAGEAASAYPKGTGLTPGSTHVCAILQA